ncbi:hypothetical protein CCYA_CCYA08G2391 [Cyanidiococcus yangmingshanensis]|nr:hypothetical protein CCYA_CCYA08G2391 [Cyanidiococcus yangmingshanensis]
MTESSDPDAYDMVEMVSYTEEFHSDALTTFLRRRHVLDLGLRYHTVAVLGCQSSGKSTLLNLLFGTRFPTMDASLGRYQVTRGIWLGVDARSGRILVLDLEGTDSRERGETAASFERKSALFALALAEVLVINVWAQDVGRYNAANLALLRTVLEQDVALFHREARRTRLLFVLRDHVSTPLVLLEQTLRDDLERIWSSISKPAALEKASLSTFFDVEYTSLPHKEFHADAFCQAVDGLRERFYKRESEIFQDSYHRGIAADGFSTFCKQIWQVVRENRELDIPTEKEALARIRCEEIAHEVAAFFDEQALDLAAAYDRVMELYAERSARYIGHVAEAKRQSLHELLSLRARDAYLHRLHTQIEEAGNRFECFMQVTLGTDAIKSKPWQGFVGRLERHCDELDTAWTNVATIPTPFVNDEPWCTMLRDQTRRYRERLETLSAQARQRVANLLLDEAATYFTQRVQEPLWDALDHAGEDQEVLSFWDQVQKQVIDRVRGESELRLMDLLAEAGLENTEQQQQQTATSTRKLLEQHREQTAELVRRHLRELGQSTSSLLLHVMKRFEDAFRFEPKHRVPRVWRPSDDVRAAWTEAIQFAMYLLTLMQHVSIDHVESCMLHETQLQSIRGALEERAAGIYTEAVRAQEAARVHHRIPWWILIIMAMLGWNEFVALLQRPLLLLFMLFMVAVLVVLERLRLFAPARRAAQAIAWRMVAGAVRSLQEMGAPGDWSTVRVPSTSDRSAAHLSNPAKHHSE